MTLPSAAELVAQYLRANGYSETLRSFVQEAGLPTDIGTSSAKAVTIEQILQEKKTFDLSLNFEKLGLNEGQSWKNPAPSIPTILNTLPTKSNILSVHALDILRPGSHESKQYLAATTANRQLNLIDPFDSSFPLLPSYGQIQDSPILDVMVIDSKYLLVASMSGKLVVYNTATDKVTDERRDHSKYLVKIASWTTTESTIIATAGWDAKIYLYELQIDSEDRARLGEPFSTLTVSTIPETILFVQAPGTPTPVLLLTRRDSTFLFYYLVVRPGNCVPGIFLLGRQNLAPHSNAWIAFSPSDVQLCPTDTTIAGVVTSSTPHMKLLIVRLLVPPAPSSPTESSPHSTSATTDHATESDLASDMRPATQAAQARAELLVQDREEAAIIINVNTMSPQTAYSTPRLAWRPDGSGIYVSSDDGRIRGFEVSTGKLIVSLEAHESLSKIRCLWAGHLHQGSDQVAREALISGGFDQKLIIWNTS